MAQHDYNIEDQNGFDFLVDLNNALSAIVTNNAGSFEPNPTFAHMLWFDKNNDLMKVRNEANSAWVIVAKKDASGWTPYRQGTALGTASVQPDDRYAHRDNNLSDLGSAATARANLGVVFSKEYQSTGQPMIMAGLLTLAHGLSADPKLIRLYAIATVAAHGFSIGDKLDLAATVNTFPSGSSMGLTVTFDSTNIYIRNGNSAYLWQIPNKSTGTLETLQRADFDLYVEAYA